MKKTAKESAVMQEAVDLLDKQHGALPVNEEAATDIVYDVHRFATRTQEAAESSIDELQQARKKVKKYLLKNAK